MTRFAWLLLAGSTIQAASASVPLASRDDACRMISGRLASVELSDCQQAELGLAEAGSPLGLPILVGDYPPRQTRGERPRRVLLVGGIHGDELSSVSVVFRWIRRLQADRYRNIHWRVIPSLNPDGLLRRPSSRTNSRGVDLNRNFPALPAQPSPIAYWVKRTRKDPRCFPGPEPLSEPESAWLAAEIERFAPDAMVQVHAPYGVLDYDGPPEPPSRMGYLHLKLLGAYPGSLGNYMGIGQGHPTITLELPHAGIMPTAQQQLRIWADLTRWIDENVSPRPEPPLYLQLANNPWAAPYTTGREPAGGGYAALRRP